MTRRPRRTRMMKEGQEEAERRPTGGQREVQIGKQKAERKPKGGR